MSKPLVPEVMPLSDISDYDRVKIDAWIGEGKPGIATLTDEHLARAMEMYIGGRSYREISQTLNIQKVIIQYIADRYGWTTMKDEILDEMDLTLKARVADSKIRSTDLLLKMSHALQKKVSKNIDKYLSTDNEQYLQAINKEQFAQLMKVIEALHRTDAPKIPTSAVNINMNMGNANISKLPDGSVDITGTKEKTVAAKLKEMADARRAEDRQQLQSPDIKNKNQGDPQ
jgi:hypothetical protein